MINNELEKYLYEDPDSYYLNYDGEKRAQSVHGKSFLRYNKAKEQAQCTIVDKEIIIKVIKKFFERIGIKTTENPIIKKPETVDYSKIKEKFNLENQSDLIWIKFTTDGYVGVIAAGDDINFDIPKNSSDYDKKHKVYNEYLKKYEYKWVYNTSGIIIHKLGKTWDKSFVLVFPLKNIPTGYKRGDIEKAVGNLLLEKGIPILDCFSHLY